MNATMNAKGIKLDSSLVKQLPIADLSLGYEFLAFKHHYNLYYEEPQMNQENFNLVCNQK